MKDNKNSIEKIEHDEVLKLKKVALYAWDGTKAVMVACESDGSIKITT